MRNFWSHFGNLILEQDSSWVTAAARALMLTLLKEELATLSRPRQCCWDATAQSDALFIRSGPSPSGPQLPRTTHTQTPSAITMHAHTHMHAYMYAHAQTWQDVCMCVNNLRRVYSTNRTTIDNIHSSVAWYEHTSTHYIDTHQFKPLPSSPQTKLYNCIII